MNKSFKYILLTLLMVFVIILIPDGDKKEYKNIQGFIFGTTYSVIYEAPRELDYENELHAHLLSVVDSSLSTFNPASIISLVNNNQPHQVDSAFEAVFVKAKQLSAISNGAFDMTVAPLVNVWGFGYTGKDEEVPEEAIIDSLKTLVGFSTVSLASGQVIKENSGTKLDASAIAKGYGVDVACDFLRRKGVTNYMVEIGGEIRVKGLNKSGIRWRLGIDKPIENSNAFRRAIDTVLHLDNHALATSGNYRQFYYKGGKRYSHTIDPRTGYPVNHSLLSATVIAPDCMTADAIATACMVLGAEEGLRLAQELDSVEVYFIVDKEGEMVSLYSEGMMGFFEP